MALTTVPDIKGTLSKSLLQELFPSHLRLVPQLNEMYELELAFYESRLLADEELVHRAAYFSHVEERPTRHFLICRGEPLRLAEHSSSRLKSFFRTNQFKTGYATHGLFPYRGKFHPQMVKGLLNLMGLRPGQTVLDPMMGSGTTLIEATLMGIQSVGTDTSPFCQFMTQAKLDGFRVPLKSVEVSLQNPEAIFEYFSQTSGHPGKPSKRPGQVSLELERTSRPPTRLTRNRGLLGILEDKRVRNFLLLAYLDSAGYSIRSQRKPPLDQFRAILERYYFVASKIQNVLKGTEAELGKAKALIGDARNIDLQDSEVDGVLFSPPYSFAIDYVANDAFHLRALGVDMNLLRQDMVGLRGGSLKEKYDLYVQDMKRVLGECHRVLKRRGFCTIVVGTNNQQLAKILEVEPEDVKPIGGLLVDLGRDAGLAFVRKIERQITGMANTMRSESILLLQRE